MPEEINRLVTDQVSDLLFTPSADADENLRQEGIEARKIHLVGNVMIDTSGPLPAAHRITTERTIREIRPRHAARPSNVDDLPWLRQMLERLSTLSAELAVVFPVHREPGSASPPSDCISRAMATYFLVEPKPYLEFLGLQRRATVIITDSGGIQEEATFLGVPCLTVRENTERPVTVNLLVGRDIDRLQLEVRRILDGR